MLAANLFGYLVNILRHSDLPQVAFINVIQPEIDRVWAEEARKRWAAYKAGKAPTVS